MLRRLWRHDTARLVSVLVFLLTLLTFLLWRLASLQQEKQRRELETASFQDQTRVKSAEKILSNMKERVRLQALGDLRVGQTSENLVAWLDLQSGKIHLQGDPPVFEFPPIDTRTTDGQAIDVERWLTRLDDDRKFPSGRSYRMTATIEVARAAVTLREDQLAVWQQNMVRLWRQDGPEDGMGLTAMLQRLPDSLRRHFDFHQRLVDRSRGIRQPGLWIKGKQRIGIVHFSQDEWQEARDLLDGLGVELLPDQYSINPTIQPRQNMGDLGEKHRNERFILYGTAALFFLTFLVLGLSIQALLASQKRKQIMVHTVSHEFRTPLASMLQFAELLKDKRYASPDKVDVYLTLLYQQGLRLKALIENVMTFAKIEKSVLRLNPVVFELQAFLEEICDFYAQMDPFFRDHLQLTLDHPPIEAVYDREALNRLLTNLIDNARKYGEPPIIVHAWLDGDFWMLSVRDHGPGIDEDLAQRLFKPYARGSGSAKDGLGLGLSVVKALVAAMDGHIETASQDGFHITIRLPLIRAEESDENHDLPN